MSRLQKLNKELMDTKHMMSMNLQNEKYFGSYYHYWVKKKEDILLKIKEL